jgi:hypothetical protein
LLCHVFFLPLFGDGREEKPRLPMEGTGQRLMGCTCVTIISIFHFKAKGSVNTPAEKFPQFYSQGTVPESWAAACGLSAKERARSGA